MFFGQIHPRGTLLLSTHPTNPSWCKNTSTFFILFIVCWEQVHTCIQNFYSTMKRNVMQKAQLCYYLVDALTDLLHIFVFLFYWHSALLSYSPNNNTTTNKKMYCLAWNSPALWPFWGHFWHLATTNTVVQLISITNGYSVCL